MRSFGVSLVILLLLTPLASASAPDLRTSVAIEPGADLLHRLVRVTVENVGDASAAASLLVHMVAPNDGWRIISVQSIEVAPGEVWSGTFDVDMTGVIGRVRIHADASPQFDADYADNSAVATTSVGPDVGVGYIVVNGHGFCVGPLGLGACALVHSEDSSTAVGGAARLFLYGGAWLRDDPSSTTLTACVGALLGPIPVRELHCETVPLP